VTSVVIDRGVGAGLLIAIGFAILLLLPSSLTTLGGYREIVLACLEQVAANAPGLLRDREV